MKEDLIKYEAWRSKQVMQNKTAEEWINDYTSDMSNIKHFVKFFYPGSFMSEESIEEINDRNDIEVPKYAFCYQFFDEIGGETINKTGRYYFGEVLNIEQVKTLNTDGKLDILIANMGYNNWDQVIKTRAGNYQPFEDNDKCVSLQYYREQKLKRILKL